jgi:hypothetical protein
VEAESWSTLHAVQKDSAFLSSEGIAVRRFHAILLWPVRVTPFGELKKLQDNPDTGSSDYLRQCVTWLSGPGLPWNIIPDYYEDAGRRDAPTEDQRYAEYLYFHPYIERCFYSSAARRAVVREADSAKSHLPMLILQRRDIIAARIRLRDDSPTWRFEVARTNLFISPTNVAIAAVEIQNPICEQDSATVFSLADTLDILDCVRRLYPPYIGEWRGNRYPGGVPSGVEWLGASGELIGKRSDYSDLRRFEATIKRGCVRASAHWESLLEPMAPL